MSKRKVANGANGAGRSTGNQQAAVSELEASLRAAGESYDLAGSFELYTNTARRICALAQPPSPQVSNPTLLLRLFSLIPCPPSRRDHGALNSARWLEQALQSGAVGATASLINTALEVHPRSTAQHTSALQSFVHMCVAALSAVWQGELLSMTQQSDWTSSTPALYAQLVDQSMQPEVLGALSRVCGYIQNEIWPAVAAASVLAPSGAAGGHGSRGWPDWASTEAGWDEMNFGCVTLGIVADMMCSILKGSRMGTDGKGAGGKRKFMRCAAALAQSSLLATLSSAFLAVPTLPATPLPQLSAATARAGSIGITDKFEVCACGLMEAVRNLTESIRALTAETDHGGAAAVAAVDTPQVLQLQRELLRQVALAVDQFPGTPQALAYASAGVSGRNRTCTAAGRSSSNSSTTSNSISGSGGGSGGNGGAVQRWHILQYDVRSMIAPSTTRLDFAAVLIQCVLAAVGPVHLLGRDASRAEGSRLVLKLFPSVAEAATLCAGALRTLAACLAELDAAAAAAAAGGQTGRSSRHVPSINSDEFRDEASRLAVVQAGGVLVQVMLYRMRHASMDEATDALPDLLEAVAWHAGAVAAAMRLAAASKLASDFGRGYNMSGFVVMALAGLLQGQAFNTPVQIDINSICGTLPGAGATIWRRLSPERQADCLQRLIPTDLLRSLDVLLRDCAANGSWRRQPDPQQPAAGQSQQLQPSPFPVILSVAMAELVGLLMHARLVRWQEQDGSAAADDRDGGIQWRIQDELGLLLTCLKLLRREVAMAELQRQQPRQSQTPQWRMQLLRWEKETASARLGLVCFVSSLGLGRTGLPLMLQALGYKTTPGLPARGRAKAAPGKSGGTGGKAAGSSGGSGSQPQSQPRRGSGADVVAAIVQAMAACSLAALPSWLLQVDAALANLRRANGVFSPGPLGVCPRCSGTQVAGEAIRAVMLAVVHLPPGLLLAAAPQRLLAALGALLAAVSDWDKKTRQMCGEEDEEEMSELEVFLAVVIARVASDERLVAGCVPGWLWADPAVEDRSQRGEGTKSWHIRVHFGELAALHGDGGCGVLTKPVVRLWQNCHPAAQKFRAWRWADEYGNRTAEVAALARSFMADSPVLQEAGTGTGAGTGAGAWQLLQLAAAAKGTPRAAGGGEDAELVMWPPRLLRLCANPLCGDYSGGSEAELKLKRCSKCDSVRYCGADCQRQHWPQHKKECDGWRHACGASDEPGSRRGAAGANAGAAKGAVASRKKGGGGGARPGNGSADGRDGICNGPVSGAAEEGCAAKAVSPDCSADSGGCESALAVTKASDSVEMPHSRSPDPGRLERLAPALEVTSRNQVPAYYWMAAVVLALACLGALLHLGAATSFMGWDSPPS